MPIDQRALRSFALQDNPESGKGSRGQIVEAVQRSSFTIEYILDQNPYATASELGRGEVFGLFIKPNQSAKRMFGLDREVLLWCSTFASFQARDVDAIFKVMEEHGSRLSRQVAVLVTNYDRSERSALEYEANSDLSLVHLSLRDFRSAGLDSLLARHLFSRNLFDVSGAAVSAADFFGRRDLLDRLVSEIELGTSQAGVFGLRKVGKTSLLNRLSDRLRNSGKVVVARLDLQWTTSINGRAEYTLWAMGESIYAAHRSVRSIKGFKLFGQFATFSEVSDANAIWEWFAHDIGKIATVSRRRLCILVDEIERMYEIPSERGFVRFWRLLRGLDQQYPGRLRFVIGGTSPQCAELGVVDGQDNPLFNYLQLEYLGPLQAEDAGLLLQTLGSLMGLDFEPSGVAWALEQCGGHPALLRVLGSTVHDANPIRVAPVRIDRAVLTRLEPVLSRRSAPILDQMVAALQDQYRTEYDLLDFVATGRIFQYREYAGVFPREEERLRHYGLIGGIETPVITIRQLHANLVKRDQRHGLNVADGRLLGAGAELGPWRVEACLASGGYADVFRVRQGDDVAAAKVLRNGRLSALEREVDALSSLSHPGIVRFLDALLSATGEPCLIMEFLEGKHAGEYCSPVSAPSTLDWFRWIGAILSALESMHPRIDYARKLSSRESMTSAEFDDWGRARHGHIHRDIKPENIMIVPGRGPVLIDFNIAVLAGAPALTSSSTMGYLPAVPVAWQPSCDLYGLGVTALELAAGGRLSMSSLEELKEVARAHHGDSVCEVAGLLLGAVETGRGAGDILRQMTRWWPRK